jgi:hypothetical protein
MAEEKNRWISNSYKLTITFYCFCRHAGVKQTKHHIRYQIINHDG